MNKTTHTSIFLLKTSCFKSKFHFKSGGFGESEWEKYVLKRSLLCLISPLEIYKWNSNQSWSSDWLWSICHSCVFLLVWLADGIGCVSSPDMQAADHCLCGILSHVLSRVLVVLLRGFCAGLYLFLPFLAGFIPPSSG